MDRKKVTIVLEESKYAHDFSENQNIHIIEYERVKELVDNQINQITKISQTSKDNKPSPRKKIGILHQHNTISIFGTVL